MPEMPEHKAQEMTNAIFAGRKIEAIKIYKESTGVDLKTAKEFVDDLERQLREECPDQFGDATGDVAAYRDATDAVNEAIFAGRKIEAIKIYRESTGLGLKESKEHVEAIERKLREERPQKFTAPAKSGCGAVVLCLLATLGMGTLTVVLFSHSILLRTLPN